MRNLLPSKVVHILEQTSIFVFAISGIVLYLIGLLVYLQWTRHDAQSADPVLSDIHEITNEISQAHVLYMELAVHNNFEDLKNVAAHLQRAIDIAEGHPTRNSKFYKLSHNLQNSVTLDEHLGNIKNITYSLQKIVDLTSKGIYTIDLDGDELFDKLHREALITARNSTAIVQQMIQRHLWNQQNTFLLLIALGIAGLFFTGISIYYYYKKNRRIKKALWESEEKMRAYLDNIYDTIWLINSDLSISYASPSVARLLGISPEEVIGRPSIIMIHPEDMDTVANAHRHVLEHPEEPHSIQYRVRRKDGRWIYVESISVNMRDNPMINGVLVTMRDITERKHAEEKLQKAKEKAEETTKLKDKFIAMVAHDIRTPFSTIMGFLQLIQSDDAHPLCPKHRDTIKRCLGVGENLINLTENLLNMNRLNNGKIVLQTRFIDASFVANHVIHLLEPLARKKGIRLLNSIPKFTRIFADMELYHQVIENLASNAIKFSNKGDTITLFIHQENPTGIAVKDTGVGIPKERHPHLFEVTHNRSTLGTHREKGTGLGLPYCHDIMLAHGGSLEFESTEGAGTVFYTRLPIRRPLVMVVDDDDLIRFGVREWLELLETEVIDASNGREAIKKIENSAPNLIISDIFMPDMDGIDFASQIKKMDPYREIPLIFMTAQPDAKAEIRKRITYFNDNDFISKPFGRDDLIEKTKKYVGIPFQHGYSINQQA